MKLAFRRHRGSHNHTEIVFQDGTWATSVPSQGVRFDRGPFPGDYDFVDVDGDEGPVRECFQEHLGDRYDWAAFLTGKDNAQREYCTEVCVLALHEINLFPELVPHLTHAEQLYQRAIQTKGL